MAGEEGARVSIGSICRRRCRRSMRSRVSGMLDLAFGIEDTIIEGRGMAWHRDETFAFGWSRSFFGNFSKWR